MVRDVVGYEGYYTVDTDGSVYSIKSKKKLATIRMKSGYNYVHLHKNGVSKLLRLHRVVAETYIENPFGYTQVNHINGDKNDNSVDNLEWCTPEQNLMHAIKTGLKNMKGENNPSAKLKKYQIEEIRKKYIKGDRQFGTKGLAKQYGVTNVMIGKIVRGECWKQTGFSADRSLHREG
jgi:hypothetical protein